MNDWLLGSGLRVLVIDELHNILAGNAARRREFLNLLRFLGNRLRVSLVGVGTGEAYLAIRADDQLENRFQPVVLPRGRGGDTPHRPPPDLRTRTALTARLNELVLRHRVSVSAVLCTVDLGI